MFNYSHASSILHTSYFKLKFHYTIDTLPTVILFRQKFKNYFSSYRAPCHCVQLHIPNPIENLLLTKNV